MLISGLLIGHATSPVGRTGCTAVLTPGGAVAGVSVRGGAPGTRETALLDADKLVDRVHGVLLTGGSAFGLAAADGVVRWLHERGYGWPTRAGVVPIVPAVVLYDLDEPLVWPDAALGYAACEAASGDWPEEGRVGAGTGATVGKILGFDRGSPGGIGAASLRLDDGTTVGALVAVNALGHVVDLRDGRIVAGPRLPDGEFADTIDVMLGRGDRVGASAPEPEPPAPGTNTTIGVIWTDAPLDKVACNRVADIAHNGLARVVRPAHTQFDGDTLFVLSLPPRLPDQSTVRAEARDAAMALSRIGVAASEVVAAAVVRAVGVR